MGIALAAILLAYEVYKFVEESVEAESTSAPATSSSTTTAVTTDSDSDIQAATATKVQKSAADASAEDKNLSERVRRFFEREVNRIGQTTDNPEMAEARLQKFAELLSREELRGLRLHALSADTEADARFLSTYLLANSGNAAAIPELLKIATSPMPKPSPNSAQNSFELALRAQAVEGLGKSADKAAARAAARQVANRSGETFLVDRAQRVLHQLQGGKSVESQDREALEALLKR